MVGLSKDIQLSINKIIVVLQPPCALHTGLGCSHFARHYSGNLIRFLFLQLLRCFTSLGLLHFWWPGITLVGLPHSEISGSKRSSRSPKHIAGRHVLHRLSVPRHPPCALNILLNKIIGMSYDHLM